MEDVVKGVRGDWLEQGVDPLVIDELRDVWAGRLAAIHDDPEPEQILFGAGEAAAAPPPPLPPGRPMPKGVKREDNDSEGNEPSEKKPKVAKLEGEESLSSLGSSDEDLVALPGGEEEADEAEEGEGNVVLAQWEQVKSTSTTVQGVSAGKWKAKLRLGLASLNGQDWVFKSAEAHLKRW
jgi:hypothetical protein